MFDSRNTQIADNYQQFVESLIQNFRKIGSAIEELLKAIQEKEESKKESSKVNDVQDKDNKLSSVDIQVDKEKYRLVPDEEFPGAWKWESAEMTDFQEQTVLRRLVTEPVVNPEVHPSITDVERDSSLSVVAYTKGGESVVVYHQDSKGICHTNLITTNLSSEEILDIINQIITSPEIENETKIQGKPKQKTAASYTYEQISDSDVSPETKRWVREVEVPISNAVANSREEQARLKLENIKIAQTVVEMLKAYGEETIHGYEAYKSDAFVIKLESSKYSIHHRRDELYCFGNPLMQFSLDSKGNPKIEISPTQMLPVERQEFLMVRERLESGKELPQLAIAIREDIANNLGSLAPAGTFKAIQENHQWAEGILPIANNIFQATRLENRVESKARGTEASVEPTLRPSKGIEIVQGNNYQLQLNRNDKTMNISSINDNRTVASYDLAAKTVITANPTEQDKQSWFLMSQKSQVKQSKRNDIEL